jgi:hypothetical protein
VPINSEQYSVAVHAVFGVFVIAYSGILLFAKAEVLLYLVNII